MKRRFLSTLMALCLALSLLPTAAFAAEGDEAPVEEMPVEVQPMEEPLEEEPAGPTASGNYFFANGTPITITATPPRSGEKVEKVSFTGFSATGESAYISWDDNGTTKYVGVNDTSAYVFGGSDGRKEAVTVPSTSINMTGGTIYRLFGGNYGEEGADTKFRSEVTGNVNISLSGTAVVKDLLHGAGARNTCVSGTVRMTFNRVNLSDPSTKLYVNGGSWGNGNEGIRDIEGGSMDTGAVANKVIIEANNSDFYLLSAGGSGSTKVNDAEVTLTDCKVNVLYLGGINGEVEDSSITATGCEIESFSATNRGFVGEGHVDLNGCEVGKLNTGAANGCFTSDSGGTDGSGVTRSCVWDLDESTTVKDAQLTPLVIKNSGSYTNTYENLTIQKAGDQLELEITSFVADENNASTTQNIFTVPEGSTLTLNGVTATVTAGSTLTNAGAIEMDGSSSLTVPKGATFNQVGEVTGTVSGDGTINKDYVARVGSTGYTTLQDAINAAGKGDTVTLLKSFDVSLDGVEQTSGAILIKENITLDGNGKTITATATDSSKGKAHIIVVGSSANVTIEDLNLDGNDQIARYGIQAYGERTKLTLDTVNSYDNYAYSFFANDAEVVATNVTTSGNGWGGVNVDKGGKLTVDSGTFNDKYSVVIEGTGNEATLNGGTYENIQVKTTEDQTNTLTITGGEYKDIVGDDNGGSPKENHKTVKGGTFNNSFKKLADYTLA